MTLSRWLSRFFQYVRNEFSQFVSIVSGYTPFQYYAGTDRRIFSTLLRALAGPYSPWDKNIEFTLFYFGSGGYVPPSLQMRYIELGFLFFYNACSLGREYLTDEGAFLVSHTFNWYRTSRKKDSFYQLFLSVFTV